MNPYQNVDSRHLSLHKTVKRLAEIADCAWRGYSTHDLKWRYRYYGDLFASDSMMLRSVRLVEYSDQKNNVSEDCAFVVILPLTARVAMKHLRGELSQYTFSNSDLEGTIPRSGPTYHYFQSFYRNPQHRKSDALKFLMYRNIVDALKRQGCGRIDHPFTLYAETSIPKGREITKRHGLAESRLLSSEHHPFFILDSEVGDVGEVAKLRKACSLPL